MWAVTTAVWRGSLLSVTVQNRVNGPQEGEQLGFPASSNCDLGPPGTGTCSASPCRGHQGHGAGFSRCSARQPRASVPGAVDEPEALEVGVPDVAQEVRDARVEAQGPPLVEDEALVADGPLQGAGEHVAVLVALVDLPLRALARPGAGRIGDLHEVDVP